MGSITVEGLGQVQIDGDTPTAEESRVIIDAQQNLIRGGAVEPPIAGAPEPQPLSSFSTGQPEPTIPQDIPDLPLGERVMNSLVNRGTLVVANALAGSVQGARAGRATGSPAASMVGSVVGGGLGAMAGSAEFDLGRGISAFLRGGDIPEEVSIGAGTRRAFREAGFDTGAAMGMELITKGASRAFKPLVPRLLGLSRPEINRIVGQAEVIPRTDDPATGLARSGIDIGIAQASKSGPSRLFTRVLGVFPFISGPIRNAQGKVVTQIDEAAADILNTLAPPQVLSKLSEDLTRNAGRNFKKFNRIASSLYKNFNNLADNLSVPDIAPTSFVKDAVGDIEREAAKEQIDIVTGTQTRGAGFTQAIEQTATTRPLRTPLPDDLVEFLGDLKNLPENITVRQVRGLERTLNALSRKAAGEGFDVSRLTSIKQSLVEGLDNIDVSKLQPGEGEAVLAARQQANRFFAEGIKPFERTAARGFKRVDKNIFGKGFAIPGTLEPDQVFSSVFKSNSPQALRDLRRLVGETGFRRASRAFLDNAFDNARVPAGEGLSLPDLFSAQRFERNLKLNTRDGQAVLAEIFKGTDVPVKDFLQFLNVAKTGTDIIVRDPSTFLARRIILAGGAGAAGGVIVGAGNVGLPAAVLVTLLARKGAKTLMDPKVLRGVLRLQKQNLPNSEKQRVLVRLFRAADLNSEEDFRRLAERREEAAAPF